ncbi:MAG: Gfo/Idh/MocA family oxidoreductase [Clostridia bacterium]
MLNIGMVGCGSIAMSHISVIKENAAAKICAVCDNSPEKATAAAAETGAIAFYDYKEMADAMPLDCVIISLPHALHAPCAKFFAARKINIFLEKPMEVSAQACREIIDACDKNGVALAIGHIQAYFSDNIAAKAIIDSGEYGDLIGMTETRNVLYFTETRPRWFLNKELSGGGILMNLGAHAVDKIKFFSGSSIKRAVGCAHTAAANTVDGAAMAFLKTDNGIAATINIGGYAATNEYKTMLYLAKGIITIESGTVRVAGSDGVFHDVDTAEECAVKLQMDEFIARMISKDSPRIGGEYGLDVVNAIEMIYAE